MCNTHLVTRQNPKFFSVCVSVPKSIILFDDGTWDASIVGRKLEHTSDSDTIHDIPKVLAKDSVQLLVKKVAQAKICIGNEEFVLLLNKQDIKGYTIDTYQSYETVSKECQL